MQTNIDTKLKRNNIVSTLYVSIILGIFPLIYNNYYFDILIFKYKFYYIATIIFALIISLSNIIYLIHNKQYGFSLSRLVNRLSISELSILFFVILTIISTLQSDYLYESFWGNEGRYTGCFTLVLYGVSIIFIKRYLRFKTWIIDLFLLSGFLVCCFGITDYFKLDILGFKVNMDLGQYNMFMSTIGNINTYTSYVALIMAVSTLMFSIEKKQWKMFLYYFCMICSFTAIIMGLSDNSYLSIIALFVFLPLYLFKTNSGLRRYLLIITTLLGVVFFVTCISKAIPGSVVEMQGILTYLPVNVLKMFFLIMVCITVTIYLWSYFSKSNKESFGECLRFIWLGGIILLVGVFIFILYDVNIALNLKRYGSITQYLLFNDDWGTHRGYNWRIGLENYMAFPLIHKIFGYGPDTYGLLTHFNNYKDMTEKYSEIYDSVHNEYLQYFITMGPLSLISYIVFLISSIVEMIRNSKKTTYVIAVIFAVLCYSVQAFVNISVPIVAPIMLVLLATGLAANGEDILKGTKEIVC